MARNRDRVSRNTSRSDRFVSRVNGERYQTRIPSYTRRGDDTAVDRKRGRRGVRARRREERIERRISNGTYRPPASRATNIYPVGMRQPSGGTISNSP